jgi:hypothetical protein
MLPEVGNPIAYDRYMYVSNSPIMLSDPSGHCASGDYHCWIEYGNTVTALGFTPAGLESWEISNLVDLSNWIDSGIVFQGTWTGSDLETVRKSLTASQSFLGQRTIAALGLYDGNLYIRKGIDEEWLIKYHSKETAGVAPCYDTNSICFASTGALTPSLFLHELGHIVDWHILEEKGAWSTDNFNNGNWPRKIFGLWGDRYYTGRPLESVTGLLGPPTDQGNEFADTFAWAVMSKPDSNGGNLLPGGWNRYNNLDSNNPRLIDLNIGINLLAVSSTP